MLSGVNLLVRNLQKAEPECSGAKNGIQLMTLFFRKPPRKTFAHNCARTHNHRIDKSFLSARAGLSSLRLRADKMLPPANCRYPTRASLATASLSISNLLVFSSGVKLAVPVILPPGRARLATKPEPTGSECSSSRWGWC